MLAAFFLTASSVLIAADPAVKPAIKKTAPADKAKVVTPPTSKQKPVSNTPVVVAPKRPTPSPAAFKPVVITTEMLIFSAEVK